MQRLVIVTPALASANNGNWQTARRWASMLRADYRVRLTNAWKGGDEALMIALHARRSADAVAAWRAAHPQRPLVVVLTGTDLYRDIAVDDRARQSLQWADRLVVLQALGGNMLPPELKHKVVVCVQSSPPRQTLAKTGRHLRALMVGHLRHEKSPETLFAAARALRQRPDILLDHIGAPLDAALGRAAQACMAECPQYRWLGALPHAQTRRRIQQAHVLVHASRLEGGAHVVIEAVTSGTPVLASRIDGNLGLLGSDYEGVFDCGDAAGLATLLQRCRDEPAMLARLLSQCERRRPLFAPERERATLQHLVAELLHPSPETPS
ncbi:MAG: TIGR04348 family glycosyltransferase [Rubrivivax sp.]|nr:TIGR04348 family glycosyltransferase [Rubrivivax sp.]MBK7262101.1 TIGR04348 family glycosyltransferase [Rubrivivax sp.]MBK8528314.1 TIGR04348 family glycosyltransferase [Rubrivivax sp.]